MRTYTLMYTDMEFLVIYDILTEEFYIHLVILLGVFYKSSFSNIFILDLETFIHLLFL